MRNLFLALTVFAAIGAARADSVKLPVLGGAGGEHFEYQCTDDGYLVGLSGYTGLWIDNVQAVCAQYDPATGRMKHRAAEGPVFGGAQGKANATNTNVLPCVRDQLIFAFDVTETKNQPVLGRVRLFCVFSTTFKRTNDSNGITIEGEDDFKRDRLGVHIKFAKCPEGQAAVGIRGRSGTYLDAFGLICGPVARASTRPQQITLSTVHADGRGENFLNPTVRLPSGETIAVDWCREWATNCGKPAAEVYCGLAGYGYVQKFEVSRTTARTVVMSSHQICSGAHCKGFNEISCRKTDELQGEESQGPSPFGSYVVDKRGIGLAEKNSTVSDVAAEPTRCRAGFVWRLARPEDLVCVTPASRTRTASENTEAANFVDPAGAYGPNTCIAGYVWRGAFEGDAVCVTPQARAQVREENRLAPERRAGN